MQDLIIGFLALLCLTALLVALYKGDFGARH